MHERAVILTLSAAATIAGGAAPLAIAQDFLSVPEVTTSTPAVFVELFDRPRQGLLHALMVGDSQETCPLGHGLEYMPAFNAAWAARYGTCGRTPLVQPGINFGSDFSGEWLVRGERLWPFINDYPPATAPDALPGLANWSLPAITTNQRGWIALLQPRATSIAAGVPIDHARRWFDVSQGVYVDVYAIRDPAYGNIAARWSVSAADATDASAQPFGQGQTDLAAAPGGSPVARHRFGPITWNAGESQNGGLQVEFTGADAAKPARLVSISFVSVATPVGLSITDIAAGGYNAASLPSNHAAALDQLSGLDVDCAFITLGANDAWVTPAVFKQNMAALIASLRAHTTPGLPVVLMTDPWHNYLTTAAWDNLERFPRACAELAAELPAVCAVNSRRLTHEHGWTPTSGATYMVDGVHYNAAGATLKANLEVETLWNAFVCQADIGRQGGLSGRDAQLDNNDFIAFIDAFFAARPIADMGRQGGLPGSDGQFDNNDFIAFINAFFTGCG